MIYTNQRIAVTEKETKMSSASKESKDGAGKEKRRSKKTVKSDSSPPEKKIKATCSATIQKKENGKTLFNHEETTVDRHDAVVDLKKHTATCDEFRTILAEMKAIKDKGTVVNHKSISSTELPSITERQ